MCVHLNKQGARSEEHSATLMYDARSLYMNYVHMYRAGSLHPSGSPADTVYNGDAMCGGQLQRAPTFGTVAGAGTSWDRSSRAAERLVARLGAEVNMADRL
jgi:hypothetical protein